ncbi:chaplin [Kitasatospora sp. NPDC056531]|uniref:chaplin n=1 Tax=Kitasatospora sp. NPDC056531 TaxID=3345856 RepID=UPI0036856858
MQNVKKVAVLSAAAAGLVLGAAGSAAANSGAQGVAAGSPGFVSGNQLQVPLDIPINLCGNTLGAGGLLNPAFGNSCANVEVHPKHEDDC